MESLVLLSGTTSVQESQLAPDTPESVKYALD